MGEGCPLHPLRLREPEGIGVGTDPSDSNPRSSSSPELGMQAVWKIAVKSYMTFIVLVDNGNDFFAGI